ncbi:MAG: class I SAM-dependent methyltransferase [Kiritimatiellae bacterium]|nr:class I SAM-dependent methyltransferase [Kiritimatiellia bacterium]MDD5522602.1 class I SAM-dependent methyltransferase [Kiritimatiellia bacterium]
MNMVQRNKELFQKCFPSGEIFALRSNFEWGYFEKEKEFVERYLPKTTSNILIIASGNGREARPISHMKHKIVCMDNCLMYLLSARTLFKSEKTKSVHLVQADAESLPFADSSFDFIFFSIYSLLKDKRFIVMRQLLRMLRPGGIILLTTFTPLYHIQGPRDDSWAFFKDGEELRNDLSLCGCEVIEEDVDPKRPGYRLAILRDKNNIL